MKSKELPGWLKVGEDRGLWPAVESWVELAWVCVAYASNFRAHFRMVVARRNTSEEGWTLTKYAQ